MATLSSTKKQKLKKRKRKVFLIITAIQLSICPLFVYVMHQVLIRIASGSINMKDIDTNYFRAISVIFADKGTIIIFVCTQILFCVALMLVTLRVNHEIEDIETIAVTDKIRIPIAAGNGQFGNQRFMREEEKEEVFNVLRYTGNREIPKKRGGIVVHYKNVKGIDYIYYVGGDVFSIMYGATGSGKTRRVLIASIVLQLLAGESIFASDIKGEISYSTCDFAKSLGYKDLTLDLIYPRKSVHYNFLQPTINALENRDISKAIDCIWDLVSVLVGQPKGEPLWTNGESATLATSLMIVAADAPREFKNMTNAYFFISRMCRIDKNGEMPLTKYINEHITVNHPAYGLFDMAELAPYRTRASFFTSALGTLKLFANPNIAEMTSRSDFNLEDTVKEKVILYTRIPDEKKTYYPIVSLLITQMYAAQITVANENGLRVPNLFTYDIDECGNFPYIPILATMTSAGRSRGIRGNYVFQSESQGAAKYKEDWQDIKTNCTAKILLKSDEEKTIKAFSDSFGAYTVESKGASTGISDGQKVNINYSDSSSLTKRMLLEPSEVSMIDAPYLLCKVTGEFGAVNVLPDLSKYKFNSELGLGDEEFNKKLFIKKESEREERPISNLKLWNVWEKYKVEEKKVQEEQIQTKETEEKKGRKSYIHENSN